MRPIAIDATAVSAALLPPHSAARAHEKEPRAIRDKSGAPMNQHAAKVIGDLPSLAAVLRRGEREIKRLRRLIVGQ